VGATVPETVRETVQAVHDLALELGATVRDIALKLTLDRSATQRRVQAARERGYLLNLEEKRGRPARYVIGDPLPEELDLLPKDLSQGVQHTPCDADAGLHSITPEDVNDFEVGVQLCSESGEVEHGEYLNPGDL
jgi:hypothetical protein